MTDNMASQVGEIYTQGDKEMIKWTTTYKISKSKYLTYSSTLLLTQYACNLISI